MPLPALSALVASLVLALAASPGRGDLAPPADASPAFDETEALRRLGDAPSAAWIEDGTLFAIVRAEADAVTLISAVQAPLAALSTPDHWGGAFPIERADEAVLSCGFGVRIDGRFTRLHDTPPIRGPHARPAPPLADPLRGTLTEHEVSSITLGSPRTVHVYLPPDVAPDDVEQVVFLADGQALPRYAPVVEPLVVSGTIPPTAIVGIASDTSGGRGDPATDARAMEYLIDFAALAPGADPERFDRHWTFFTEEVPAWVEREHGIRVPATRRLVAGTSNGGAFAAAVAARAPDRFGASIILSSGWRPVIDLFDALPTAPRSHRAFLSAGVHEPAFLEQTRALHDAAARAGYEATFDERVGGHDPLIWREQLAEGLRWLARDGHRPNAD